MTSKNSKPASKNSKNSKSKPASAAVKLDKTAIVSLQYDTEVFKLSFAEFSKRVSKAVKDNPPKPHASQRHILSVRYMDKGKPASVTVTPLYFHEHVMGRPLYKVSKSGQSLHPAVNPLQVIDRIKRYFSPAGWVTAETKE